MTVPNEACAPLLMVFCPRPGVIRARSKFRVGRRARHAPIFHSLASRRNRGSSVVPVVGTRDASLADAREVVDYYEAIDQKLYPTEPEDCAEAKRLFDLFSSALVWQST